MWFDDMVLAKNYVFDLMRNVDYQQRIFISDSYFDFGFDNLAPFCDML